MINKRKEKQQNKKANTRTRRAFHGDVMVMALKIWKIYCVGIATTTIIIIIIRLFYFRVQHTLARFTLCSNMNAIAIAIVQRRTCVRCSCVWSYVATCSAAHTRALYISAKMSATDGTHCNVTKT